MSEDRRVDDSRITTLCEDVAVLKQQMLENTQVTTQVRDILASFKIVAAVAKWIGVVGAGVVAAHHGIDWLRGR